MYKIQIYDEDIESWEDDNESGSFSNKFYTEDELKQVKRNCAYQY